MVPVPKTTVFFPLRQHPPFLEDFTLGDMAILLIGISPDVYWPRELLVAKNQHNQALVTVSDLQGLLGSNHSLATIISVISLVVFLHTAVTFSEQIVGFIDYIIELNVPCIAGLQPHRDHSA